MREKKVNVLKYSNYMFCHFTLNRSQYTVHRELLANYYCLIITMIFAMFAKLFLCRCDSYVSKRKRSILIARNYYSDHKTAD